MMLREMPRYRNQDGWVELRGSRWYGHYYIYIKVESGEERKHRGLSIGPKSPTLRKFEAEQKLREHIQKVNGAGTAKPDDRKTLKWFMENRWIPLHESNWKESTAHRNKQIFERHIYPTLGESQLCDFDKVMLQVFLTKMAAKYAGPQVKQVRIFLMSVFDEALEQEYIQKDPARKLLVPKTIRAVDKSTLSWEQFHGVLGKLSGANRLAVDVDMFGALRPGELFALRWKCLQENKLELQESIYNGKLRPYLKTEKSTGYVFLPAPLVKELKAWRKRSTYAGDNDFIFPNSQGGWIAESNFLRRVLKPIKESLKLPRLHFQLLRRTFATMAQSEGSVKDVQGQLRHSRPDTAANEYMQIVPASVQKMVESLYVKCKAAKPITKSIQ